MWAIPALAWSGIYVSARLLGGYTGMDSLSYLTASMFCIFSIAGLSTQETARLGNSLGQVGIFIGVVTTLTTLYGRVDPWTYAQIGIALAGGAAVGLTIAERVEVTGLPQLVAGFHSVVGLAAVVVSFAQYIGEVHAFAHSPIGNIQRVAIFLGSVIGGVTFTGSLVAFAKLNGNWKSDALQVWESVGRWGGWVLERGGGG